MKTICIVLIISANVVPCYFQTHQYKKPDNQVQKDSLLDIISRLVSQVQDAIYSFVDSLTYQADKEHFIKTVNEILLEFIRLMFDLLPVPSRIKDVATRIAACVNTTLKNFMNAVKNLANNIKGCIQSLLDNLLVWIGSAIFNISDLVSKLVACEDDHCKVEVIKEIPLLLRKILDEFLEAIAKVISCLKAALQILKENLIATSTGSIHCFIDNNQNATTTVMQTRSIVTDLLELVRLLVDAVVQLWNKIHGKFVPLFTGLSVDGKYKLRLLVEEIWQYILEAIEQLRRSMETDFKIIHTIADIGKLVSPDLLEKAVDYMYLE